MGVVEGPRDCWCMAGGKIGAGRCEAKRVEREVQQWIIQVDSLVVWWLGEVW